MCKIPSHLRGASALGVILLLLASCAPAGAPSSHPAASRPEPRDSFQAMLARSQDLGPANEDLQVSVVLLLKDRTQARQAADLAAMYNPHSPSFGHFQSARQFEKAYGPAPGAIARLTAILRRKGLRTDWARGTSWLSVRGPVRRIQNVFGVHVHGYISHSGVRYYASARDPSVPAGLGWIVTGAGHLSSYFPIHADQPPYDPIPRVGYRGSGYHTQRVPGVSSGTRWGQSGDPRTMGGTTVNGLKPADLLTAYDIKPLRDLHLDGQGETVVFLEADSFDQHNLDVFSRKFGLPLVRPKVYNIAGANPPLTAGETELDLEIVHEIAPRARLVVYNFNVPPSDQPGSKFPVERAKFLHRAIADHKGDVFSESYSICETIWGARRAQMIAKEYDLADHLGISAFAATGDSAAYQCLNAANDGTPPSTRYLSVALPASVPGVTAVGGTRLSLGPNGRWQGETVWEDPAETQGTGGGYSVYFKRPFWQRGAGVQSFLNPNDMRSIPDVAADADDASGPAIYGTDSYGNSSWHQGSGTSQAAPIWAAIATLINQYLKKQGLHRVGFMNPALYTIAGTKQRYPAFHDVTVGTNLFYPATRGYDMATGLGSPDAWNLARDLASYIKQGHR